MSDCIDTNSASMPSGLSSGLGSTGGAFARVFAYSAAKCTSVVQQLGLWTARHRQRHQLAALSDIQLKDIGLSRSDIEGEVVKPFWK